LVVRVAAECHRVSAATHGNHRRRPAPRAFLPPRERFLTPPGWTACGRSTGAGVDCHPVAAAANRKKGIDANQTTSPGWSPDLKNTRKVFKAKSDRLIM